MPVGGAALHGGGGRGVNCNNASPTLSLLLDCAGVKPGGSFCYAAPRATPCLVNAPLPGRADACIGVAAY